MVAIMKIFKLGFRRHVVNAQRVARTARERHTARTASQLYFLYNGSFICLFSCNIILLVLTYGVMFYDVRKKHNGMNYFIR